MVYALLLMAGADREELEKALEGPEDVRAERLAFAREEGIL